jgi:hypothetical protein
MKTRKKLVESIILITTVIFIINNVNAGNLPDRFKQACQDQGHTKAGVESCCTVACTAWNIEIPNPSQVNPACIADCKGSQC